MKTSLRLTEDRLESLKSLLESQMSWPNPYVFKFIVPKQEVASVKKLLSPHSISERSSQKGIYVGVTAKILMASPQDVIEVYKKASLIKNLMAL